MEGGNSIYESDWCFDNQILLFRRHFNGKRSPNWHAKIKVPAARGHIKISTRTRYKEEAFRIAVDEFRKAEGRTRMGYPLKRVTFRRVCREYLEWKREQYQSQHCSEASYLYHQTVVEQSLHPFFGEELIDQINGDAINSYQSKRTNLGAKKGRKVSGATLNRDNAVIRAVFKYAKRHKYLNEMPEIDNVSAFARRPSFTTKEAKIFVEKLDEWVDGIHIFDGPHVRDYRRIFRLYCLTMIHSGIRPGKEMASLRWEDIKQAPEHQGGYVSLFVKTSKRKLGEQADRRVIAPPTLWKAFQSLKGTLLYPDEGYIFAHPATTHLEKQFVGLPISSFKMQWDAFIDWAGLEFEAKPPYRRRTLYSLRHLYFEQMLAHSNAGLIDLATNGGTSPEVISKWYHSLESDDYAVRLSQVGTTEN